MSNENTFKALLRASQASSPSPSSREDKSRAPEPTAAELITKVISDLRQISISSNTEAAVQAIQRLNPDQKKQLLNRYKRSLTGIKNSRDAFQILAALKPPVEAE